jgi:hypothetical protein
VISRKGRGSFQDTFCSGSTTVARLLERKVGKTLGIVLLVEVSLVSALAEGFPNMLDKFGRNSGGGRIQIDLVVVSQQQQLRNADL